MQGAREEERQVCVMRSPRLIIILKLGSYYAGSNIRIACFFRRHARPYDIDVPEKFSEGFPGEFSIPLVERTDFPRRRQFQ